MDHGGHNMNMAAAPPMGMPPPRNKHNIIMHMTFYWGYDAEILFDGWPGTRLNTYLVSLLVVFLLAFLVEWISRTRVVSRVTNHRVGSGLLLTGLHAIRMCLAYFVMLAVMSYNVGVFMVAILGHAVGFMVSGTQIFGLGPDQDGPGRKPPALPPMSC